MKKLVTTIAFLILFCFSPLIIKAENNVVELTVSGSGATQDDARQNALRNAVEEAFGAFVSSNTQILNDKLIKDEIVSVSSGNIQDYKVLSETQTPDGNWANTIKATVSIDKLTSFAESKGVTSEFKGSLFAANVKLQELNKQNEEVAVKNMCQVCKELAEKCFDYEIKVGEPKAKPSETHLDSGIRYKNHSLSTNIDGTVAFKDKLWCIPLSIYAIPNKNLQTIANYFCSTLYGVSISKSDKNEYSKLGENTYSFYVNKTKLALRSKISLEYINSFLTYFRKVVLNFQIVTNIDTIMGFDLTYSPPSISDISHGLYKVESVFEFHDLGFSPTIAIGNPDDISLIRKSIFFSNVNVNEEFSRSLSGKLSPTLSGEWDYPLLNVSGVNAIGVFFSDLSIGKKVIEINFLDFRTPDELSKISGYKIEYCKNTAHVVEDRNGFASYEVKKEE